MTDVRDAATIRADLRTLGRLPVTLTDQDAPLRLAGDVAPLLDRCGFLARVLERAERERDDASAELAVLRAQRDAALAACDTAEEHHDREAAEATALDADSPAAASKRGRAGGVYYVSQLVRAALGVQPEGSGNGTD